MGSGPSAPAAPNYTQLAEQQADINQQAMEHQTRANRPTQIGVFGNVDWAMDPETGRWIQKESLDPRVQGLVDQSLATQQAQMGKLGKLSGQADFKTTPGAALYNQADPGMTAYDPKTGEAYAKTFTESLLARTRPGQQAAQEQMQTKLRLQGLQPGTEAYNRAYQNLLTSQGDVNAQATLQGMLAGGKESRDIYNTRLAAAMQLAENQRAGYTTRMQGQQQMNQQALQEYMNPYNTAGLAQDLNQGAFGGYLPSYQGFGTAGGAPGADLMGAAQQQYQQAAATAADRAARRQATGSAVGGAIGMAAGAYFGAGNPAAMSAGGAAGSAVGGYFSDAALKHDIQDISDEDAYYAMQRIRPHSFSWPSGNRSAGLVAQEVAQVFPHLVHEGPGGYLMVDYESFTAILLGAFRHLAKEKANA